MDNHKPIPTLARPENTIEPILFEELESQSLATGLGIEDLVKSKPERIVLQWLAAEIPFLVQLNNDPSLDRDRKYLAVAEEIRRDHIFSNPNDPNVALRWNGLATQLAEYHRGITRHVDDAIQIVFNSEKRPDVTQKITDVIHQIHRLISLRRDLGFCEFTDEQVVKMTRDLAIAYFYNTEANQQTKFFARNSIQAAISGSKNIEPLVHDRKAMRKNIQVSGGQGAGKTTISRSSLEILDGDTFVRINKDLCRPIVLSPIDAERELDLQTPEGRRTYGAVTEDELRVIKKKQWITIREYSAIGKLPQVFIDSTMVGDSANTEILANDNMRLTLLHVNTSFSEARERVVQRAVGDGIPGVDSMRESLHSEMLAGHRWSSLEVASMLIHDVGKPIKLKVLDGHSAELNKPVQALADLKSGVFDIYNARAILEIFHKAEEGKTETPPGEKDLRAQIYHFGKIAAVMSEINLFDESSGEKVVSYDNTNGVRIENKDLYDRHYSGTLAGEVVICLAYFHQSQKATLLNDIAVRKGQVFQTRLPFKPDEPLRVVTGRYETEVPVVSASGYVYDDDNDRLLELRHLAKRGQFLDGGFDPWRKLATTDIRMLAAKKVVDSWLSDGVVAAILNETLSNVKKAGTDEHPLVVHVAHPMKDFTRAGVNINHMVLVYGIELTRRLNAMAQLQGHNIYFMRDRPLLALASDKSTRTTATALERLTSQPLYDPDIFKTGDHVLFVDEHVQAGGVMLAARNVGAFVDINVVGYSALSCHNQGVNLSISPQIAQGLEKALADNAKSKGADLTEFSGDFDRMLSHSGLARETLSNIEGLILIAYLIDGKDDAKVDWYANLSSSVRVGEVIMSEGMDSLRGIVSADPVTPKELEARVLRQIQKSRKAVYSGSKVKLG